MNRDDVRRWVIDGAASGQDPAFWIGAETALDGRFSEGDCMPAGFVDETDFCAGGREALQRLREADNAQRPAKRLQHGAIVDQRNS